MRPVWGGIIARRHDQQSCIDSMECWMASELRYSRRDQLSILVGLYKYSFKNLRINSIDDFGSEFHTWPIDNGPRSEKYLTHYFDQTLEQKISIILAEGDSAVAERDSIANSTIWKLFSPYRKLIRFIRRI